MPFTCFYDRPVSAGREAVHDLTDFVEKSHLLSITNPCINTGKSVRRGRRRATKKDDLYNKIQDYVLKGKVVFAGIAVIKNFAISKRPISRINITSITDTAWREGIHGEMLRESLMVDDSPCLGSLGSEKTGWILI